MSLPESLLTESTVWLFGRVLQDIQLVPVHERRDVYRAGPGGGDSELRRNPGENLVLNKLGADGAQLARIYSFSYHGEFFHLDVPAIFVVHGDGADPNALGGDGERTFSLGDVGLTGLGGQAHAFSAGVRVWAFDQDDHTLRLDSMSGTISKILLECELADKGLHQLVRGGGDFGQPAPLAGPRARRRRRWRSDDD